MKRWWAVLLVVGAGCSSSTAPPDAGPNPLNPSGHTCGGGVHFCDGQDAEVFCQCTASQCCFLVDLDAAEQCCDLATN